MTILWTVLLVAAFWMLYGVRVGVETLQTLGLLLRSTVVTLWRGGVVWRGAFSLLEELRKGMV